MLNLNSALESTSDFSQISASCDDSTVECRLKKIVVIGATSAIAEQCLRLWLKKAPAHLILVGRNEKKLQQVADDLLVRSPGSHIEIRQAELQDFKAISPLVHDVAQGEPIDLALIAYGFLPDQKACQQDVQLNYEALALNGLSPVLLAEALAAKMQEANHGTLALISSVAGDRGRKSNYIYGAAKGLINTYIQGLQHRFASSPVRFVLVKPGPTNTPMTVHLKEKKQFLASASGVAQCIVQGIEEKKTVIYAPKRWAVIMFIIRCLPLWVFNRLDI